MVRVLKFPVLLAALIMKSFSFLFLIKKIHCLTSKFHRKFYAKYRLLDVKSPISFLFTSF